MTLWEFICELNSAVSLMLLELGEVPAFDMVFQQVEIKARPQKLKVSWTLEATYDIQAFAYQEEEVDLEVDSMVEQVEFASRFLEELAANGLLKDRNGRAVTAMRVTALGP